MEHAELGWEELAKDTVGIDGVKHKIISLIGHRLRTPLCVVRWNLEIMLDGDVGHLSPEQIKIAQSTYQSGLNAIAEVNALLIDLENMRSR